MTIDEQTEVYARSWEEFQRIMEDPTASAAIECWRLTNRLPSFSSPSSSIDSRYTGSCGVKTTAHPATDYETDKR